MSSSQTRWNNEFHYTFLNYFGDPYSFQSKQSVSHDDDFALVDHVCMDCINVVV